MFVDRKRIKLIARFNVYFYNRMQFEVVVTNGALLNIITGMYSYLIQPLF